MKVRVYRKSGDNEYPEVLVDELCTTDAVGKAKGLCFLYENGLDKLVYDMDVRYTGLLSPNDVVFIDDSSIGESFYGRVKDIKISGNRTDGSLDITRTITIERYIE